MLGNLKYGQKALLEKSLKLIEIIFSHTIFTAAGVKFYNF